MQSDDKIQNLQHYSRIQSFITITAQKKKRKKEKKNCCPRFQETQWKCVGRAKREAVTFSGADPNYGMATWIFTNIAR